jgi:repressor LexA
MKTLSVKQQGVFDYLKQFVDKHGYAPSLRDISGDCGLKSPTVALYYLNVLEREGYINRSKRIPRSITFAVNTNQLHTVPLLGIIAAGNPIPVPNDDVWEKVPEDAVEVPKNILNGHNNVFALKVKGTSMIDALIDDGDMVLLTQSNNAEDGSMVAVWLKDRHEVTLKKIYRETNRIRLQPANRLMEPIFCNPEDVEVQGKVIGVIRETS